MERSLLFATYNVLAQCFVEPERYTEASPELLEAPRRQQALLDGITRLGASVVLLQEVEQSLLTALQDRLGERYHVLWSRRPTHSDGCAILVSRAVEILGHQTLVYQDHEPGYSQVACVADLHAAGRDITVVSTHLRCGCQALPGQPPLGFLQLGELLAFIQRRPAHACILGGDLNATPDSPTLQAAYAAGFQRTGDRPTAFIRGRREKRDYLLHTGMHLSALPLPHFATLPCAAHPSDHVALQARLTAW